MSEPDLELVVHGLIKSYYQLISGDHHKDRDCHFFIAKRWSYADDPYYEIMHSGYIMDTQPEQRDMYHTYKDARAGLIAMLTRGIESETKRRNASGEFIE